MLIDCATPAAPITRESSSPCPASGIAKCPQPTGLPARVQPNVVAISPAEGNPNKTPESNLPGPNLGRPPLSVRPGPPLASSATDISGCPPRRAKRDALNLGSMVNPGPPGYVHGNLEKKTKELLLPARELMCIKAPAVGCCRGEEGADEQRHLR